MNIKEAFPLIFPAREPEFLPATPLPTDDGVTRMSADFIFGWSYIIKDCKLLFKAFLLFPSLAFKRSGWTKLFTYGINI